MGVDLRPNLHYTAELDDRIGIVIAVRTDERDRASYVIEEVEGKNSILPTGKDTTLSSFSSFEDAESYMEDRVRELELRKK